MDRRDLLGFLGAGAAGLIVTSGREIQAQHPASPRQAPRRLPQGLRGMHHGLQRDVSPLLREGQGRSRRPPQDRHPSRSTARNSAALRPS